MRTSMGRLLKSRIIQAGVGLALLAAGCLCLLSTALAAPGSWTQKADMPAPASATCGCVVDGVLYVIGGLYPYPGLPLRTVWAYDPQTDSWSRKADMPTARRFLAAAAVDGIIFVVGGTTGDFYSQVAVPAMEAYDPKTDTWITKTSMPSSRGMLAVCAVDGVIYAIGGLTGSFANNHPLSAVEAYDPQTDHWTTKSSLPKACHFLTASVAGGTIYAFQGTNTFAYDPKTNRWTATAGYAPWSEGLMSATVDGIIYLFGGMTEDLYGSFDFALAYDPAQDRFTARRRMPRTRLLSACGVIEGQIYLAGGVSKEPVVNPNPVYYTVLDVFDPRGGVTPQILSGSLESSNSFRLVWQAEAGIKYGVESSPNATGPWTRATLPTGTTITATNGLVETTCTVPSGAAMRFFRVLEAN